MPNSDRPLDGIVSRLAKVIERRRQELRISQEELAKRAGLSRTYLSDIERGLRNISVATLAKIAQAMHTQGSSMLALAEQTAVFEEPIAANVSADG